MDRKLNLVLTVDREPGPAYVHCQPLNQLVTERYFLTLSKTYAAMTELGGEWLLRMGPRFAYLMLRRVAEADDAWAGSEGVEMGLVNEMRRTATVLLPSEGGGGWSPLPLADALEKGFLSPEDGREVLSALTFFTVACSCLRPAEADTQLSLVFGLWGAPITSLSCTEWAASLPTSTPAASTGEKATASSIPA